MMIGSNPRYCIKTSARGSSSPAKPTSRLKPQSWQNVPCTPMRARRKDVPLPRAATPSSYKAASAWMQPKTLKVKSPSAVSMLGQPLSSIVAASSACPHDAYNALANAAANTRLIFLSLMSWWLMMLQEECHSRTLRLRQVHIAAF